MKKIYHKDSNKGFTLAEMLVVVAIIGVLISITITSFSNVLENAREATDMANIRSGYAMLQAALIDDYGIESVDFKKTQASKYVGKVVKINSSDDSKVTNGSYLTSVNLKQKKSGWQSLKTKKLVISTFSWAPDTNVEGASKYRCLYFAMDADGKIIQYARGK